MLCRACLRARLGKRLSSQAAPILADISASPSSPTRALSLLSSKRQTTHSVPIYVSSPPGNTAPESRPILPAVPVWGSRLYASSSAGSPAAEPQSHDSPSAGLEKPTYLDEAESVIWDRLVAEFAPAELLVQDISGGCGSMYGIEIASDKFRGTTMLKQQRMVNAVLGDLMKGWHGVQLKTRTP